MIIRGGSTTASASAAVPQPTRQRRSLRRTFKVGKSPTSPQVSVLLSNRTLRKQINNQKLSSKQVPLNDVKKFLIKRGLIKVGTIAPNEVLRKMYEDATMTCGEIYNHNPDVLLFNFFHHKD
jgi:hypothetical protein